MPGRRLADCQRGFTLLEMLVALVVLGFLIIGLTQGLFDVTQDATGASTVSRGATSESMLDARTGRLVKDEAIQMQLKDFTVRISTTLGKGPTQ